MGNLNFQDDPNENPQQNQPDPAQNKDTLNEEAFIDDPTGGTSKFLWIAIIVILIAGGGGAIYLLNRSGYLKFPGKKSQPAVSMTAPAPVQQPAPAPAAATSATRPTSGAPGSYALQVSAFKTRPQAERFLSAVQKKGVQAWIVESPGSNGGKWFRVCTGTFDTKLKAIAAIQNMKSKVGTDVWVVPVQ